MSSVRSVLTPKPVSPEGLMFKRIDHVELVTDRLEQTVAFYTGVLGFAVRVRDRIERSGWGRQSTPSTWSSAAPPSS